VGSAMGALPATVRDPWPHTTTTESGTELAALSLLVWWRPPEIAFNLIEPEELEIKFPSS